MTIKLVLFSVLAVGILLISTTTFAHHGEAGSYDNTVRITVKATVTELIWVNPHAQLYIDFKNNEGETEHWGIEMLSPGNLVRIGWHKDTFKPEDEILVTMTPAKGDRPFGSCGQIVSSDGKMFMVGQCGVPGGDVGKLPVKAGYTAVEVKFPKFPTGQNVTGPAVQQP